MPKIQQLNWSKLQPKQKPRPAYNHTRDKKSKRAKSKKKPGSAVKDKGIWQYREEKITADMMQIGKM